MSSYYYNGYYGSGNAYNPADYYSQTGYYQQPSQGYYGSPYQPPPSQGYYYSSPYPSPPVQDYYYPSSPSSQSYSNPYSQYYEHSYGALSGPSFSQGSSVPSTPGYLVQQAAPVDDYEFRRAQDNSKYNSSWIHHLVEVPNWHSAYRDISTQYIRQWRHTPNPPPVHKIYRIKCGPIDKMKFKLYRSKVGLRAGVADGNTIHSWHGTVRACKIGDDGASLNPCSSQECSLCMIIRKSYDVSRSRTRHKWGRFGAGIYTSSTSSKAYHYTAGNVRSPYAALLLNEVVMGNPARLTYNSDRLTEPPAGYDSVQGIPVGHLNYDEAVVYNNKAIRPMYLVLVATISGWQHNTCLQFES